MLFYNFFLKKCFLIQYTTLGHQYLMQLIFRISCFEIVFLGVYYFRETNFPESIFYEKLVFRIFSKLNLILFRLYIFYPKWGSKCKYSIFCSFLKNMLILIFKLLIMILRILIITIYYLYHKYYIFLWL